jgi:hypothetical protein
MATNGNSKALKVKAVAYIRTSSAANVGADRDSDKRRPLREISPEPASTALSMLEARE